MVKDSKCAILLCILNMYNLSVGTLGPPLQLSPSQLDEIGSTVLHAHFKYVVGRSHYYYFIAK